MGIKKIFLNIFLSILYYITLCLPIKKNKIAFISLESEHLESDMKLIYEALIDKPYKLVCVLISFKNNGLWMNFLYFLNTLKQIFVINTSALVIINDNNYVISNFKRKGVKVLQVWHAAGAIKKFGNTIKRTYPINNYDYVLCNGSFWVKPYSEAFNVKENQVIITGMPRLDCLTDTAFLESSKESLYQKYPDLKDKRVILYAPTFRGNIYVGMKKVPIDLEKISKLLSDEYVILYKLHPLLKHESFKTNNLIYNMNNEDLHKLFSITDILISDFSSIIFDFSLLSKPIYAFVPDLNTYLHKRGCFIEYSDLMRGVIAKNEEELVSLIRNRVEGNAENIRKHYLECSDGNNLKRTIMFIENVMKDLL